MAPADDPQICILVLLDDPDAGCGFAVSGGAMGAPTVGNMMADILPYLGVEAEYTESDLATMDRSVPNLVNMPVNEAEELLRSQNLDYRIIGIGRNVTMQLPAANTVVAAKSQILLYADGEGSDELEEVPDLVNLSYDIARQRMGWYALFINADSNFVADPEKAIVIRQSIEPGEEVEHGTVVTVTLSTADESTNAQM